MSVLRLCVLRCVCLSVCVCVCVCGYYCVVRRTRGTAHLLAYVALCCGWFVSARHASTLAVARLSASHPQRPANKAPANVSFDMEEEALREIAAEEAEEAKKAADMKTWKTVFVAVGVPL